MLSKQEKLKYGEELRRQMLEKEEKKRMERDQKRGIQRSPTDNHIVPSVPQNNSYIERNKEQLQAKFEQDDYNYYGKPGGGAPNPTRNPQQMPTNNQNMQPIDSRPLSDPYYPYQPQIRQPYPNRVKAPEPYDLQHYAPQTYDYGQQDQRQRIPNNYQMPPQRPQYSYENHAQQFFDQPTYQQSNSHQKPQGYQRFPTDRSIEEPPNYRQGYPPEQRSPDFYEPYQNQNTRQYGHEPQYQDQGYMQVPLQQINDKHAAFRQKTVENDELMEIHKKGGRNLLKLENMSIQQQQIKNKQKEQMRRQLEMQMKEAEQRKLKEKERIKKEQQQEERRNQEYLLQQKMKLEQQQRKKQEKQRELQEQNLKNLQDRKRLEEEAKEKAKKQKQKLQSQKQSVVVKSPVIPVNPAQNFTRQAQRQLGVQTTSSASSSTVMDEAFKTDSSKEYFEMERRKNQERYNRQRNLQAVTDQIERLKSQIERQTDLFNKQFQEIKLKSEMAESQKNKAHREIEDLKNQLKKKMDDDNERLFKALQKQEKLKYETDSYDDQPPPKRMPKRHQNNEVITLRPPKTNEKMILKKYDASEEAREYNREQRNFDPQLEQSNVSEDGLGSLRGESKKIPINLPNDKLSMSQLSQYARETNYFRNEGKGQKPGFQKSSLNVHNSIVEEDEDRVESRAKSRNSAKHQKDQLDNLLQSRPKAWGQMSSVNSDITKQIEELLKKKDHHNYNPNQGYNYQNAPDYQVSTYQNNGRPPSNLSNAGKRTLSRDGMAYDGVSLNTYNSQAHGSINTFDVDRINNRNENRLNELRKLGVETINSNDGELSKLDDILNRYKEQKSRML